jgi:hypothetical protein
MSSGALQRLTNKKGNKLSKFLGIDSGPSTRIIANMQARINNPLFKLSMADYEVMCGNKMMVRMMSKVLGCEEKQLKKFCKYINVFKENIKSSPKSIKNKIIDMKSLNASKMRGSLNTLPDNVYSVIVEQYKKLFKIKYVLKDWVPINKLNWNMVSKNPNAIDLLKANPTKINWLFLSANPNAIELLEANPDKINWLFLSTNPNAIELLKANPEEIYWEELSENPNAIELLEANPNEIDWGMLSSNPAAIELLRENRDKIYWDMLSLNPNPAAIELLQENPNEIDWDMLSENPAAIELLKANRDKINWKFLSMNPNAIELLKANQDKIDWKVLSTKPSIFDEILE